MLLDTIKKNRKVLATSYDGKYNIVQVQLSVHDQQLYLTNGIWAIKLDDKAADTVCFSMQHDDTIFEAISNKVGNRAGVFLLDDKHGVIPACDYCGFHLELFDDSQTSGKYFMMCHVCKHVEEIPEDQVMFITEDWPTA